MERVTKALMMLSLLLVVLGNVEGGRRMLKESVKHPETFNLGGGNGRLPSTPPGNFAAGVGFGPDGLRFCTFPGGCTNGILPNIPGTSVGNGAGGLIPHP
ncbi:unnamed protein product [Lathyrus sativus]|nr:unnamed protein product [Lathyrus sativus]